MTDVLTCRMTFSFLFLFLFLFLEQPCKFWSEKGQGFKMALFSLWSLTHQHIYHKFLILRSSVSSCVHFYSPWVSSQEQRGWAPEMFSLHDHPSLKDRFDPFFRKLLLCFICLNANVMFGVFRLVNVDVTRNEKGLSWLISNLTAFIMNVKSILNIANSTSKTKNHSSSKS